MQTHSAILDHTLNDASRDDEAKYVSQCPSCPSCCAVFRRECCVSNQAGGASAWACIKGSTWARSGRRGERHRDQCAVPVVCPS